MTTIQFPRIQYPFPSRINIHVAEAQEHICSWVRDYNLLTTEKALTRFEKSRFAWLVSRAFPDASLHELCLISDFNAWLFILDDQCDEAETGKKSAYLRSLMASLTDILHNNKVVTPAYGAPLAAALSSIWERMRAISKPSWRLRFIRDIEDYFNACIWEAENRETHIIPSVADYIKMRTHTGAVYADVTAVDIIEKIYLPEDLLQNAILQRMVLACSNVVCWANDLFSCNKESRQGDVHNLVLILRHERQCSLQEAINEAARMHNEEVAIFLVLEKLLPLTGTEKDYELLRYVSVLRSWMIGNYDWSMQDTGRYGVAAVKETVSV
ncbi:terpene synthase family protein [Chitinophaga solisilvae]|uniref:terpene synthase family protein n=1 Tax=Chitinophaga solisilvae TaxID=1233460 RepID=UPI00136DCCBE|nr:hypothetical protein [Chitinophaga solisilvae]